MSISRNKFDEKPLEGHLDCTQAPSLWGDCTPLQAHFLNRLEQLLSRKEKGYEGPLSQDWIAKALDRAVYATFRDCESQGVIAEAKALLTQAHKSN